MHDPESKNARNAKVEVSFAGAESTVSPPSQTTTLALPQPLGSGSSSSASQVAERTPRLRPAGSPQPDAETSDTEQAQPLEELLDLHEASDSQLMIRVKAGDNEAFRVLVDRYKDALVNYLTRMTYCRDRAQDYAQETFVRLYQSSDRYREQGQLAGYLYRIALNLLRSDERRNKRWRNLSDRYAAEQITTSKATPQRGLLSSEATDRVTEAIAELPLRYRAPLVLREIEGWSYKDIAESLQCREGTVKSRISRAKGRLRTILSPYWSGDESQ